VETPANKRAGADATPTLRNHCGPSISRIVVAFSVA